MDTETVSLYQWYADNLPEEGYKRMDITRGRKLKINSYSSHVSIILEFSILSVCSQKVLPTTLSFVHHLEAVDYSWNLCWRDFARVIWELFQKTHGKTRKKIESRKERKFFCQIQFHAKRQESNWNASHGRRQRPKMTTQGDYCCSCRWRLIRHQRMNNAKWGSKLMSKIQLILQTVITGHCRDARLFSTEN